MEIALQIIWQVIAACALIIAAVALHRNNKTTEDLEKLRPMRSPRLTQSA